ncbi:MAG: hypothetical protein HGA49_05820 [Eubacteriaceae bacterium]|nr:hypothetical protein [Eubacteriaceae bacterium]
MMVKTEFTPLKHGFHFSNNFINTIFKTPFGKIESRGRCGGMAFASLDYYYAKLPVPTHESKDFPNKMVPPDGSILGDYISKRSIHSLLTFSSYKFPKWTTTSDEVVFKISRKTKLVEFPKLKKSIDKGNPVVLGLISGSKISDVTKNHQVVAYGYAEPSQGKIIIFIYDSNSPNREVILESMEGTPDFKASNGRLWRGFFVQNYTYRKPAYIDLLIDCITENETSQSSSSVIKVTNRGQFSSNLKYLELVSQDNSNLDHTKKVLKPGETIMLNLQNL